MEQRTVIPGPFIVETGTYHVGGSSPEWNLDEGSGERVFRDFIPFESDYAGNPLVLVNLAGFDIIEGTNQRLVVYGESVETKGGTHGVNIVVRTWAGTRVHRVWVTWMALGSLRQ